jgi:rod shape-determining protein MreC
MTLISSLGLKSSGLRRQSRGYAAAMWLIDRPLGQANRPIAILCLMVGAFIIFTLSVRDNKAVSHLNTALLEMTSPLLDMATRPFVALESWSEVYRTHKTLRNDVALLRQENEHLLKQMQVLRQQVLDHHQYQQLAKAIPDQRMERVSARVIGVPSDGINAMIVIGATQKDGVAKNHPVITADGIVGRISNVSASYSRILPLTDLSSRIPVEIEAAQGQEVGHGIIAGQNSAELCLTHLERQVNVKVGDRLITSGYGGIFPRGLPVAVVTSVDGDVVKARPLAQKSPAFVTVLAMS